MFAFDRITYQVNDEAFKSGFHLLRIASSVEQSVSENEYSQSFAELCKYSLKFFPTLRIVPFSIKILYVF